MTSPSLPELSALSAVAAHRSFRAAAAELGVSPSSLSHAVASVERRLGIRLFNRTTRSVSLTEAGDDFLARIRPALRDIAAAVETVNRFRETPTGTLRLNASLGGAERIMPTVLGFLDANPDMRVDLAVDGRLVDIVAEGFDAGVRGGGAVPQDMVALPFGQAERYLVVASPAYFAAHGRPQTPADLLRHSCIRVRMPSGALLPWEFERRGEEIKIEPPGRLTVGSPDLAVQAAAAGAGVAYVIERAMPVELQRGDLEPVLEAWTPPFPGVCLYYPRQRLPSAGLAAFIEHFKAKRRRG
ncbi:MAG: LysR family transcriptional regulator [Phenylobacterium sp.]|uniref:LysR family transcriptional regulator n=1 Tax=Phenylobacterium sp. TaxID=1871053 RepID=UPI001A5DC9DF|nr:LysR family transcriptional regulator [Phenylobacterium sp.]MBL8556331.1 LysR family transcriptional regulator [Phenylobacterium sp.]